MLGDRQTKILDCIIEEYINTAMPVSSGRVFDIDDMGISCPTIRNEMADLTELGYLEQPHTSAGRVPTEMGYRFFVDKFLYERDRGKTDNHTEAAKRQDKDRKGFEDVKLFASDISNEVNGAVVFMDEYGELKYIGLRKVFENPEFSTRGDVVSFIDELENLEDYMDKILEIVNKEVDVFIGSENPFFERHDYGMVSRLMDDTFISIVGPMRMDYQKNIKIFQELL